MTEIYENIPEQVRQQAKFWVDMALLQHSIPTAIRMVNEYINSCANEEEQEFVDFYFRSRMESLLEHANNND